MTEDRRRDRREPGFSAEPSDNDGASDGVEQRDQWRVAPPQRRSFRSTDDGRFGAPTAEPAPAGPELEPPTFNPVQPPVRAGGDVEAARHIPRAPARAAPPEPEPPEELFDPAPPEPAAPEPAAPEPPVRRAPRRIGAGPDRTPPHRRRAEAEEPNDAAEADDEEAVERTEEEAAERAAFIEENSIGSLLIGARATAGKHDLKAVERDLRIKARYLQAIEALDVAALPKEAYLAGYVRSYARYLKDYLPLTPEEAFNKFRQELDEKIAELESEAAESVEEQAREAAGVDELEDDALDGEALAGDAEDGEGDDDDGAAFRHSAGFESVSEARARILADAKLNDPDPEPEPAPTPAQPVFQAPTRPGRPPRPEPVRRPPPAAAPIRPAAPYQRPPASVEPPPTPDGPISPDPYGAAPADPYHAAPADPHHAAPAEPPFDAQAEPPLPHEAPQPAGRPPVSAAPAADRPAAPRRAPQAPSRRVIVDDGPDEAPVRPRREARPRAASEESGEGVSKAVRRRIETVRAAPGGSQRGASASQPVSRDEMAQRAEAIRAALKARKRMEAGGGLTVARGGASAVRESPFSRVGPIATVAAAAAVVVGLSYGAWSLLSAAQRVSVEEEDRRVTVVERRDPLAASVDVRRPEASAYEEGGVLASPSGAAASASADDGFAAELEAALAGDAAAVETGGAEPAFPPFDPRPAGARAVFDVYQSAISDETPAPAFATPDYGLWATAPVLAEIRDASGGLVFSGALSDGGMIALDPAAAPHVIRLSDAAAVVMIVDDRAFGPLGPAGVSMERSLDLDDALQLPEDVALSAGLATPQ